MTATATITREIDGRDVTATIEATPELSDYGVDRSPTWIEFVDRRITELEIDGVIVPEAEWPDDIVQTMLDQDVEFTYEGDCDEW